MGLHRLIYISRAREIARYDLGDILASCERNNPRAGIGGMLLTVDGQFLQLLEGPRAAITDMMLTIGRDTRHYGIEILCAGPVEHRLFAGWSMHMMPTGAGTSALLDRYRTGVRFDCFTLSTESANALCALMSRSAGLAPEGQAAAVAPG